MSLLILYSDPLGTEEPAVTTDLGTQIVRFGELSLTQSADVGEPSGSGLEIDDPAAAYNFVGLRAVTVKETSAPSNNQIVWRGVVQDRMVFRAASMRTTSARRWSVDLVDYNWQLGRRILVDSDSHRPDETAGDRIRWLLASAAHIALNDYGNVHYPHDQMEDNDYRGQRPIDVLADCAIETGYTFWCEYNEAHQRPELFFLNPNGGSYNSTLRISNVYSDYDGSVTFLPYEDAILTRSASRIAYGVYLAFVNGSVYVRNDTTGAQFAKVDQSAPMSNVKRAARARRIATHFLNDNDEEDDRITCSIKVPVAQVNDIRAGHRMQVKFSHLPGYESFVYCRVLRRTIMQEEEGGGYVGSSNTTAYYRIMLELSPTGTAGVASCSTSLSSAVTTLLSNQAHDWGSISTTITPTSDADSIIFAVGMAANDNVPTATTIVGSGSYTTLHNGNVTAGHPAVGTFYRAVASASGSYSVTASYTPGFGFSNNEEWAVVAAAIRTSATAPVQAPAVAIGTNMVTATFATPPTPGNMIIMGVGSRLSQNWPSDIPSSFLSPTTGWTSLGKATAQTNLLSSPGTDYLELLCRCVVDGDGSTYGAGFPGLGVGSVVSISEWSIE